MKVWQVISRYLAHKITACLQLRPRCLPSLAFPKKSPLEHKTIGEKEWHDAENTEVI